MDDVEKDMVENINLKLLKGIEDSKIWILER